MNPTKGQPPYQSSNPATGEVMGRFDFCTDAEVDAGLEAAESTYRHWSGRPVADRAAVAHRIAEAFTTDRDALARLITAEMGKPYAEALEEVEFCAAIFEYYAAQGPGLLAEQPLVTESGDDAVLQRLPTGVLLGVMPWNFPMYQVARFAAPNLVLGNTILLKHAESVPRSAAALSELFADAGLPAGAYQDLRATYQQVAGIIADPRVQGVSLTGSERAGAVVAEVAGRHLKKCVLELGGSDPYILLDAPDITAAAEQAWRTRVYNTGQACNSNKRIIVLDEIADEFIAALTRICSAMTPADPASAFSTSDWHYAPMSSPAAAENVAAIVADAVARGAVLHAGGELGPGPGAYFSPALLSGVAPGMRAHDEEVFGPVAVVYRVPDEATAITVANNSGYGLGGAVFSSDLARAKRVANALEVGMANVNTTAGEGPEIPFGGIKRSGFGRELGPLGMDEFANRRLFYVSR